MFEKKFGFSYRPPVNKESSLSVQDQVTNFFFSSSLDNEQEICKMKKEIERTFVFVNIHKFEHHMIGNSKVVKATFIMQIDPKLNKLKSGLYRVALP